MNEGTKAAIDLDAYDALGPSASEVQGSLASSDVHRELARVNRLVMIEVKAVLDDAIEALVEEHCMSEVKRERENLKGGAFEN